MRVPAAAFAFLVLWGCKRGTAPSSELSHLASKPASAAAVAGRADGALQPPVVSRRSKYISIPASLQKRPPDDKLGDGFPLWTLALSHHTIQATISAPEATEVTNDWVGDDAAPILHLEVGGTIRGDWVHAPAFQIDIAQHGLGPCRLSKWLGHMRAPSSHQSSKLIRKIQNEDVPGGFVMINKLRNKKGPAYFDLAVCRNDLMCKANFLKQLEQAELARDICLTLKAGAAKPAQ